MKGHLRLKGKIHPEKLRSAVICQQSELSCRLSVMSHQLSAKLWLLPKTYYLISIIILVFVSCGAAKAQGPVQYTAPAAKAETEIMPLKIGDKIPDELWDMPHSLWNVDKNTEMVTLNDYRGKWIIMDFWNTYCGSCINAFPRVNAIQNQFKEVLRVLAVTTEDTLRFESMFKRRPFLKESILESIVNDIALTAYFPYRTVPHLVMINDEGVVMDFPKSLELTPEYIHQWLYDSQKITGKEVSNVTDL